jgi:hypothetical protein
MKYYPLPKRYALSASTDKLLSVLAQGMKLAPEVVLEAAVRLTYLTATLRPGLLTVPLPKPARPTIGPTAVKDILTALRRN